jgi:hypothetical protein
VQKFTLAFTRSSKAFETTVIFSVRWIAPWSSRSFSACSSLALHVSSTKAFMRKREWRAIYSPKLLPSSLVESSTEIVGGIPQIVYKLRLDEAKSPALAELDLSRILDRQIIGPSPYPWVMYEAFVAALSKAGIPDAENRVFISNIPVR